MSSWIGGEARLRVSQTTRKKHFVPLHVLLDRMKVCLKDRFLVAVDHRKKVPYSQSSDRNSFVKPKITKYGNLLKPLFKKNAHEKEKKNMDEENQKENCSREKDHP